MKHVLEVPAKRGHWVAYVEGRGPERYGPNSLDLDFSDGELVKTRRVRKHTINRPAILAIGEGFDGHCGECGERRKTRRYYAVTAATIEPIPTGVDIARLAEAPAPGEPGGYGSTRCKCGKPATTTDDDQLPQCDTCHPAADPNDLPVPIGGE